MSRFALLIVATLVACTKGPGDAGPPGGGGKMCTQMGCIDGVRLEVEKAGAWQPGAYVFTLTLDDAAIRCSGSLPLKPCDAGPSLVCDVEGRVQIGESGCALPADAQGFSDIQIHGSPAQVEVSLAREGQELSRIALTPTYVDSRPNGPGCEPVCRGASAKLAVP